MNQSLSRKTQQLPNNQSIEEQEWAEYVLDSPMYLELLEDDPDKLNLILDTNTEEIKMKTYKVTRSGKTVDIKLYTDGKYINKRFITSVSDEAGVVAKIKAMGHTEDTEEAKQVTQEVTKEEVVAVSDEVKEPVEEVKPKRRKRRTKADIEAEKAAKEQE